MQAASRPYVMAGTVLAAASLVAVNPLASRPFQLPIRSFDTRLVDASIANIPVNLFDDIVNIPYNEVQAVDTVAGSEFLTGSWWVPSSTNIWGIDPGDPTHVALLINLAVPFPALTQGLGGLEYQLDGLLAAELPVNASCDAQTCAPMTPPEVITGNTSYDRLIGFFEGLNSQNNFGLFDNWFHVPLSDLINGYTFNQANDPGVINPSGPVTFDPAFGFPQDGGTNPFEGGTQVINGVLTDQMPWDGTTYTLNLFQPFTNFYNSLLATPTGGIGGTGFEFPSLTDLTHALTSLPAGTILDFDPFVEGSPACPAACDIPTSLQIPALVQDIHQLDPTNPMINAWLADYAAGTANGPTQVQTGDSVALLQTGIYNLNPEKLADVDAALGRINPELPALFTNAGILTDPNYLNAPYSSAADFAPVYGGLNTNLLPTDVLTLLQDAGSNPVDPTLSTDLNTVLTDLAFPGDPSALAALFGGSAASTAAGATDPTTLSADLTTLLGGVDPTALSTDLSTLLANFGATLAPDLASALPATLLSLF
jgi:hypothetical protein